MKVKISDVVDQLEAQNKENYTSKKGELDVQSAITAQDATQRAIIEVAKVLVSFIASHEPNVTVKNHPDFPKSILTPDVKQVVDKLAELIKATNEKETDLSVLEIKLRDILEQLKQLPKSFPELPKIPEPVKEVTVLNQPDMSPAFAQLEGAIRAIQLSPVIKAGDTKVTVDTKDISATISKLEKVIVDAVQSIPITETVIDFTTLKNAINNVEKAVQGIVIPMSGGGTTPFQPTTTDYATVNGTTTIIETDGKRTLTTVATAGHITETWS